MMITITIYQNTKQNLDHEHCVELLCFLSKSYIMYCIIKLFQQKYDNFTMIPVLLLYQLFHITSQTIFKMVNGN